MESDGDTAVDGVDHVLNRIDRHCQVHQEENPLRDGDTAVDGVDQVLNRIDRRARGHGDIIEKSGRPKQLICHLCGNDFGTASLPIHVKTCQHKRRIDQLRLPESWRRAEPNGPETNAFPIPKNQKASRAQFDRYNLEAWRIYCSGSCTCCDDCGCPLISPEQKTEHIKECEGFPAIHGKRPKWLPRCLPTPKMNDDGFQDDISSSEKKNPESKVKSKLERALSDGSTLEYNKLNQNLINNDESLDPFALAVNQTISIHKEAPAKTMLRYLQLETSDQNENQKNAFQLTPLLGKVNHTNIVDWWYETHHNILQSRYSVTPPATTDGNDNVSSKELTDAHEKIDQLQNECTGLECQAKNLQKMLSETRNDLNQARNWQDLKQNEFSQAQKDALLIKEQLREAKNAILQNEYATKEREAALVAASTAAADQERALENSLQDKQLQLQAMSAQRDQALAKNEETATELITSTLEIDNLQTSLAHALDENKRVLAELDARANDLSNAKAEIEKIKDEFQAKANNLKTNAAASAEESSRKNSELENIIAKLQADNKDLERTASMSAEEASRKISELENTLARLQADNKDLEKTASMSAEEASRKTSELENLIAKLQADKKDLEKTASMSAEEASRKISELENIIAKLQADKKDQEKTASMSAEEASRKNSELENIIAKLQADNKDLERTASMSAEEASRKNSELENIIAKLQADNKDLERTASMSAEEASRKISELENVNAKLKADKKDLEKTASMSAEEASLKNSELENTLARLQADKTDLEKTASMSAEEASRKISELENVIAKLQADKKDLERIASMSAEEASRKNSELENIIAKLQADNKDLERTASMSAEEASRKISELENTLARLQADNKDLEKTVSMSAEVASRKISELENTLAKLQAEMNALEATLASTVSEKSKLEDELTKLRAEKKELENTIIDSASHLSRKKSEFEEALAKTKAHVESMTTELDARNKAHEDSAQRQQHELHTLEQEKNQLIEKLARKEIDHKEALLSVEEEKKKLYSDLVTKENIFRERESKFNQKVAAAKEAATQIESTCTKIPSEDRSTQTDFDIEDDNEASGGQLRWGASDPRWRYLRKGEGLGLTAGRRALVEQAKAAERARAESGHTNSDEEQIGLSAVAVQMGQSPVVSSTVGKQNHEIGPNAPILLKAEPDDPYSKRLERQVRRTTTSARLTTRGISSTSTPMRRPLSAVLSSAKKT